ncbi:sister chromatid cohesion 1 protein 2-like [Andrographis paniculata]|uniref:sister chromatid cohesion 1 protein 2-like n=1 Tax=Andrographis paniculata TaxID=175694 RepID=UPI0021E7E8EF|nr:sister chromatid cohesion 1 protein 2-like [Andrographis paniculata]
MFYSHLMLSKKGALGVVWMAAHCYKRLKKDQVQQTNVPASVDMILKEEVPKLTHRILAFLLLGIARIYAKKAEYLNKDCADLLNKLCEVFKKEDNTDSSLRTLRKFSIAMPNSFDLDAFDLDLCEDLDFVGGNVRPHNQLVLAEVQENNRNAHDFQCELQENTTNTLPGNAYSRHYEDRQLVLASSVNTDSSLARLGEVPNTSYFLEDRLEPLVLDVAEEEQLCMKATDTMCLTLPSLERPRDAQFSFEDCSDYMLLDGAEKEQTSHKPSDDMIGTDFPDPIKDVEFDDDSSPLTLGIESAKGTEILEATDISFEYCPTLKTSNEAEKDQGSNEPSSTESGITEKPVENLKAQLSMQEGGLERVDIAQPVAVNKRNVLEVLTPDIMSCQNMDVFPMSIGTQNPQQLDTSSPELADILTPAAQECGKIQSKPENLFDTPSAQECGKTPRKRKILLDMDTIIPNRVIKEWIANSPSALKRERKDVPKTVLQAWRACKLGQSTPSFSEPLISGMSADLASLHCDKNCAAATSGAELHANPDNFQFPACTVDEQNVDAGFPAIECPPRPAPLAPRTPTSNLGLLRPQKIGEAPDSDILEASTSHESMDKMQSSNEEELNEVFCEETTSSDIDSQAKYNYSANTRTLGCYLHRKFMAKRRKDEEEVLNLSKLLSGRRKKASARTFFEILVLKTTGCIHVQQDNNYGDVMLREASKLKQVVENFV